MDEKDDDYFIIDDEVDYITTPQYNEGYSVVSYNDQRIDPLGEPIIRVWELDENSTYFDALVAAPSDSDILTMHVIWATTITISAVICTAILLPVLLSKKARNCPFNLYLIYLMIPDCLLNWGCAINCLVNAYLGHYADPAWSCYFQSFYITFAIAANSWLNAAVARQLLKMLKAGKLQQQEAICQGTIASIGTTATTTTGSNNVASHNNKRQGEIVVHVKPPTLRHVTTEAIIIYVGSAFIASWGFYQAFGNDDWWPQNTRLWRGAVCLPFPTDTKSLVFFYVIFFPLLFLIPLIFVCYAAYSIWKEKLLPSSGKQRSLSVFFYRLAIVFVVMWIPSLFFLFVTGPWTNVWLGFFGAAWGHFQAVISSLISLLKPDIFDTFCNFYTFHPMRRSDTIMQEIEEVATAAVERDEEEQR